MIQTGKRIQLTDYLKDMLVASGWTLADASRFAYQLEITLMSSDSIQLSDGTTFIRAGIEPPAWLPGGIEGP